ncbi:ABC transporter permease [Acidihalobacter yilgarnensis]|uniref:ABC transporter permease n=1 Tax=Acidihalobacter yilgarnensis TaxID=2819280 RepID=A0A1D8IRT0_9GAMM|nr:branched-chain amino acid ABC transporter permease [Acidihalobacter yilgarnensis]AOU99202.1 ABC transporter permease [Acidihalobacter yilgarnensis]
MSGLVSYLVFFLILAAIYGVVSLGLNLQWGYTGLFNIGVAGFFAVGAYTYAILASPVTSGHLGGFNVPIPLSMVAAMLVTGVAALVIGFPTLRLRDDYLAIATIGIAFSIQLVAMNTQWLTGGTQGIYNIPQPLANVFKSNFEYNVFFLAMVLLILFVVYIALERMVHSPWGRVLMAIREDETAASSVGKNAFSYRLQSFVIGSMIMGLGGALYACFIKYISPQDFQPVLTFQIWAMLIIGGSGNNRGAVLGALLVWMLWSGSGTLVQAILPASLQVKGGAFQIILIGLVLMLTLIFKPRGILGNRRAIIPRAKQAP